ncbi:MAG TPA: hypothetical protein VLL52_18295, partial [Anaerolineae bacterium]|nr:hypothetical protein [Anaerolineae bacterium]
MYRKLFNQRPIFTLPQIGFLLLILAALIIAIDLNRRQQSTQRVGVNASALDQELSLEATRHVQLQATLIYVQSDDYTSTYARQEAGNLLPGEKRIVPLMIDAPPPPTPTPRPTQDPAHLARPWQAWWQLL